MAMLNNQMVIPKFGTFNTPRTPPFDAGLMPHL